MMTATPMLRWVTRPLTGNAPKPPNFRIAAGKVEMVLQQWWTEDVPAYMRGPMTPGEWRDVPTGVEQ